MGKNFDNRSYSINDFREWDSRKELILSPKFQRREVWSDKAKSYLIDTIIRGLPIPKIYLRQFINSKLGGSVREVVDGQQRLRTILSFLNDGFTIMKVHNSAFGGKYYSQLPEEIQKDILRYEIACDLILSNQDELVLDIFARLNTYTVSLNRQELLNSQYFGEFKHLVYSLGYEFSSFYIKNKILTEKNVVRMAEAEYTAELLITMIAGMQTQNAKNTESYYKKFEEKLPQVEKYRSQFKEVMDTISEIYGDDLKNSKFNLKPLFYSLFSVIYHFKYGLKNISFPRIQILQNNYFKIRTALDFIENILTDTDKHKQYSSFINSTEEHTTNLTQKKNRFNFIAKEIKKRVG